MNRLAAESSLYLQQHAHQPVDWFPWGPEALAQAAAADKPVLVSIGYSACHWCHVMAHECFDDPAIARLMNEKLICIKIDREERPDLDRLYMESVMMMNGGQGGWPLNVFCLPDGRPFAGGTYFPPDDRRPGLVPWPQLVARVSDAYRRQKADLEENAVAVVGNLVAGNEPPGATGEPLDPAATIQAAHAILGTLDETFGGFGEAPKFPPSMTLDFLLALRGTRAAEARPVLAEGIDSAINTTLTAMAHGGLYDQFGGGFARYSTDRHWLVPHFEKMLYDNALLLGCYARAATRYPKTLYRAIVEETVAWMERDLRLPDGTWAAALDADSGEGEGFFYTWTPAELESVLGPELATRVAAAYGITAEGTFEHGRSVPALLEADFEVRAELAAVRARLLQARAPRPAPARDPKCLLAWNALAVRGLADAAWALGRRDWLARARLAAEALWTTFRRADGSWAAVAYAGVARGHATLDDLTFLAEAWVTLGNYGDWLEPGLGGRCTARAAELADTIERHFADAESPGYFFTADTHTDVLARTKDWFDQAIPAGNSSLLHTLGWLDVLGAGPEFAARGTRLACAYPGIAARAPHGCGHALAAVVRQATGLAVVKVRGVGDLEPLRAALTARPWRAVAVRVVDDPAQPPGYQLCVGTTCLPPTDLPEAVAEVLS